jgi:hypothetical protein
VAGTLIKCDTTCKSCSGKTASDCLTCYQGQALNGGQCQGCTDPNALTCLPTNVGFVSVCKLGYSSAFYIVNGTVQNGGTCQPCGLNCLKCDQNGPGTCDLNKCFEGYVQLSGTTNCSACFGGCPQCSTSDLSFCLRCPTGQFGANGVCTPCGATCATCTNSTDCATCAIGLQLFGGVCYSVPTGCVSLSSATACSSCFSGYLLSGGICSLDATCNGTSSCTVCATGNYLSARKCYSCPSLPANCVTCDSSNTSSCFDCATGFYVSAGVCTACTAGCSSCLSGTFCSDAASGSFLVPQQDGSNSGVVGTCRSPCLTCKSDAKNCLSCVTGYSLNGTICNSDSNITVLLTLLGSGANPIISTNQTST